MSFQHAPVTKGLMITCGVVSLVAAIFDVKHNFHLQLVPHLSRDHQYWRLFTRHVAYANSSELFIWELLLFNTGINVERQYGSVKYSSYLVISTLVSTILEFLSLPLFSTYGLNRLPPGPTSLAFSVVYQYSRLVPAIYRFSIFGIVVTNRVFIYALALQLAFSQPWSTTVLACIGLLSGALYRSDLINLKGFRLPPKLVRLSSRYFLPLVGDFRPPRRSNRALPDELGVTSDEPTPEVITTAPSLSSPVDASPNERGSTSVMREWVNELTGGVNRVSSGIRVPSEAEISQLTSMFPDVPRDVVVGALQRSSTIEGAVETLLSAT